jgi:hypothetical protein
MVLSLAVSSIEKKLEIQASIIVGNYEFYYAAGKLSGLTALDGDETTDPVTLKEKVMAALENFHPAEGTAEHYLTVLLERYRPAPDYDEQMAALFRWGQTGEEPK